MGAGSSTPVDESKTIVIAPEPPAMQSFDFHEHSFTIGIFIGVVILILVACICGPLLRQLWREWRTMKSMTRSHLRNQERDAARVPNQNPA